MSLREELMDASNTTWLQYNFSLLKISLSQAITTLKVSSVIYSQRSRTQGLSSNSLLFFIFKWSAYPSKSILNSTISQNIHHCYPSCILCEKKKLYIYIYIYMSLTGLLPQLFTLHQSVSQFSCSAMANFCDPMDCSISGLFVHHKLLELSHTHVH